MNKLKLLIVEGNTKEENINFNNAGCVPQSQNFKLHIEKLEPNSEIDIVEPIDDDNYRKYAELKGLEKNLNLTSDELEDRIEWWRSAKRLGYSGFLALKNKKPIGGILFSSFGKHILEVGIVRSREDTVNHFYSQDLLKWKIIEWGIENKMLYYNLSGFNPEPQSSKEEGILRYKKKWGGQRYDFSRLFLK